MAKIYCMFLGLLLVVNFATSTDSGDKELPEHEEIEKHLADLQTELRSDLEYLKNRKSCKRGGCPWKVLRCGSRSCLAEKTDPENSFNEYRLLRCPTNYCLEDNPNELRSDGEHKLLRCRSRFCTKELDRSFKIDGDSWSES